MYNERTRYQSFKGFPDYSPVSPIRLAQAGFYYTGIGEEAVCFCCGLKVGTWNANETVFQLHSRLSPNCRFIKGENTTNVAINRRELVNNNAEDERIVHCHTAVMETGQNHEQATQLSGGANGSTREENKSFLCVSGMRTDNRNSFSRNGPSIQANGQIELYPGITCEKPKHPDYAVKSVRLSSFTDWCTGAMDPLQMAEAGFYYTGVRDCVRCFFCGGGMKDWQNGDNPWIEHARWFPNCAFVKQYKGEDFISMCRMANIDYLTNESTQNQVPPEWNFEGNGHQVEDQLIEDLNSSAAKLVMGMGYGQEDLENAIKFAREKYGAAELRAQYILECLLDNNPVNNDVATGNSNHTSSTNSDKDRVSSASVSALNKAPGSHKESDSIGEQAEINEEQHVLLEENRQLKDRMTCKICMDKDACIVFLPCGHMVSCTECARALRKCAVCRTVIQGTVRAYPA